MTGNPVDTSKVANHRNLRFESIDDVIAEIDRIENAEASGQLQSAGNWTPGQVMAHVASWIEYGYEGYPLSPPPWFIRWFLRRQLKKYLREGMPRGVKIPKVEGGTYGMDPLATQDAAARLRQAFSRLKTSETPKYHSPAFGEMNHQDRIQLNLRHAELHLGFLNY